MSEARARLLVASGRHEEARGLLRGYHAAAEGARPSAGPSCGRWRWRSGWNTGRAIGRRPCGMCCANVRLFAESPYALPMVLEQGGCEEPVREYLRRADPSSPESESARLVLAAMRRARKPLRAGPHRPRTGGAAAAAGQHGPSRRRPCSGSASMACAIICAIFSRSSTCPIGRNSSAARGNWGWRRTAGTTRDDGAHRAQPANRTGIGAQGRRDDDQTPTARFRRHCTWLFVLASASVGQHATGALGPIV